jgi:hypothetical protein
MAFWHYDFLGQFMVFDKFADMPVGPIYRSLLQKAVRRGVTHVASATVKKLILDKDLAWLRARLGVISFEECWAQVPNLNFSTDASSLLAQYSEVSGLEKNKNAAGLGALAYELSLGDRTVYSVASEAIKDLRIVGEANKRPEAFWSWIKSLDLNERQTLSVLNSESGYKLAGWPWDKSFAIATAYLSVFADKVTVKDSANVNCQDFPYWTAIDKHTPQGKVALSRCSQVFKIDRQLLGWVQFYVESAKCGSLQNSIWWEREKKWRLSKFGLDWAEAELIWSKVAPFFEDYFVSYVAQLHADLQLAENIYNKELIHQGNLI